MGLGDSVIVFNETGIVRYIGNTQFAPGEWIGIELERECGRNNGSVQGVKYFEVLKKGKYGIFVRKEILEEPNGSSEACLIKEERLHTVVDKLQKKLKKVTEESNQLKEEIKSLNDTATELKDKVTSLESSLEMTITDNEYLKGSNKDLQNELEELHTKYSEIETNYQMLEDEMNLNLQIEKEIEEQIRDGNFLELDLGLLVQHCKQLEVTVSNLQKLTSEQSEALGFQLRELKSIQLNLEMLTTEKEDLQRDLSLAHGTIVSLQEQIDSFSDLEKMIDKLSLENQDLKAETDSLKRNIEELHEIHEVDKSLEEAQQLIEKDLRDQIKQFAESLEKERVTVDNLRAANLSFDSKLKKFMEQENSLQSSSIQELASSHPNFCDNILGSSIYKDFMDLRLNVVKNIVSTFLPADSKLREPIGTIFLLRLLTSDLTLLINKISDAIYRHPKSKRLSEILKFHLSNIRQLVSIISIIIEYNPPTTSTIEFCLYLATFQSEIEAKLLSLLNTTFNDRVAEIDFNVFYSLFNKLHESFIEHFQNEDLNLYNSAMISLRFEMCYQKSMLIESAIARLRLEIQKLEISNKDYARILGDISELSSEVSVLKYQTKLQIEQTEADMIEGIELSGDRACRNELSIASFLEKYDNFVNEIESKPLLLRTEVDTSLRLALIDTAAAFLQDLKLDLESRTDNGSENPVTFSSLFSFINMQTLDSDLLNQLQILKSSNEEANQRSLDRERKLKTLQVNFELLETEMQNLRKNRKDEVNDLKKTLEDLQVEESALRKNEKHLLEQNKSLQRNLEELKSHSKSPLYNLQFKNLKVNEMQIRLDNMNDELLLAKDMLKMKGNLKTLKYDWLVHPVHKNELHIPRKVQKLNFCSKYLKEWSSSMEMINISTFHNSCLGNNHADYICKKNKEQLEVYRSLVQDLYK